MKNQDPNITFCRFYLKQVLDEVKRHPLKLNIKNAIVFKLRSFGPNPQWEFRFGEFYWCDSADNAYDARVKGWEAWLRKNPAPIRDELIVAVEFGFRQAEKGHNLETALTNFREVYSGR